MKRTSRARSRVLPAGMLLAAVIAAVLVLWQGSFGAREGAIRLPPGHIAVAFLDTGQSDCSVILTGESVVVIDAGDAGSFEEIRRFFDLNRIDTIDYLIATHPHADHIGSMREVILNYDVEQLLFPEIPEKILPDSNVYRELLQAVDETDTPLRVAGEDERIALDRGELTVLSNGGYSDLNNCSLVISYRYDGTTALFAGDAEQKAEEGMLAKGISLRADLLKVGHHGSRTSTGDDFLRQVAPRFAVICCKTGNSYGHPHPETVGRLDALGVTWFSTAEDGQVVFLSDGGSLMYLPEEAA